MGEVETEVPLEDQEISLTLEEVLLAIVVENDLNLNPEARLALQDYNGIKPGKKLLDDAVKCQADREACEAKSDAIDEKTRQRKEELAALEA